jgi:methyl-accepting chemotaxis protein
VIKFNRIGHKLGAAGLVGIVLSIGAAANHSMTQASISESNRRTDIQTQFGRLLFDAGVTFHTMELENRGLQQARTIEAANAGQKRAHEASATLNQKLDAAMAMAVKPETKERINKIKTLMTDYGTAANEISALSTKNLDLGIKRDASIASWTTALGALRESKAVKATIAEKSLLAADAEMSAIHTGSWQFIATNNEALKQDIADHAAKASQALVSARDRAGIAGRGAFDQLAAELTMYRQLADDSIGNQEKMSALTKARMAPDASQANALMGEAVARANEFIADRKVEAANDAAAANRINIGLSTIAVVTLFSMLIFTFMSVTRPLLSIIASVTRTAAGEVGVKCSGADRSDEIGDLAKTINVLAGMQIKKAKDAAEAQAKDAQEIEERRKNGLKAFGDAFEAAVSRIADTVSSASSELETSAGTLTATAERAEELATVVAAASEEASANVQSVASATEELTSSVTEISRQVQDSARIASEAVAQADATNARVSELAKAAGRIGDVVALINTIAEQTNLLALNATIEAARAGDAGRGFAVVASEVKQLAEQTAKATGEIGEHITGIQSATGDSVAAIKQIGHTIGKMSEIASTIASAVEEQGAATQEISRNIQQAAQGTQEVSSIIADVQRGASETGSASSQVLSAAQSLSGESHRLKSEVSKFLDSIRAA